MRGKSIIKDSVYEHSAYFGSIEWRVVRLYGLPMKVSEYGDCIVFKRGKWMLLNKDRKLCGYPMYTVRKKEGGHTIIGAHRLVAAIFIRNLLKNKKKVVNHIDADLDNNHYSNLEWCSRSENVSHFIHNFKLGTKYSVKQLKEMNIIKTLLPSQTTKN